MRKKIVLIGMAVLLLAALFVTSCGPSQQAETRISFVGAGMGSFNATVNTALAQMMAQEHPWLRLDVLEGPGCTAGVYALLTRTQEDGYDSTRITCSCDPDYFMAPLGMDPFDKPYPDIEDEARILGRYGWFFVTIYTTNPDIKTEQDLAGKRVAMGNPGQTGWGLLPTIYLKDIAGLDVNIDYIDPNGATQAMIDGKADAAVINISASTDFSVIKMPAAFNQLEAARKTPYWVSWSNDLISKAQAQNMIPALLPTEVPANTLPSQPQPFTLTAYHCSFAAHKDFPEDLAYEYTKFFAEHLEELTEYAALAEIISKPQDIAKGLTAATAHPGSWKYFQEQGLVQ